MTKNFLVRDNAVKRIKELCEGNTWVAAFALGASVQLLELGALNELVEMVEEWSGGLAEGGIPGNSDLIG